MANILLNIIKQVFTDLFVHLTHNKQEPMIEFDLNDTLIDDIRELEAHRKIRCNFVVFFSMDDYDRELKSIFETHCDAFYLNPCYRDGHFRV